jgi:hypothetical protein
MVNKPRIKGTNAETAVVRYLREHGHPHAERRSLRGNEDWGDITGTPGVCWEVKAAKTLALAGWLRETERERVASRSEFGILVIKPVRMGATRTDQWWAAMYRGHLDALYSAATADGRCHGPIAYPVFHLSGAKINSLSQAMKEHLYNHRSQVIIIKPKGVKEQRYEYAVSTLARLNDLVVCAGYGGGQ